MLFHKHDFTNEEITKSISQLVLNATDIDIQDQKGSSTFLVPKGEMVVKSFDITDKEIISSADWR